LLLLVEELEVLAALNIMVLGAEVLEVLERLPDFLL
jgi:hypothetical protein